MIVNENHIIDIIIKAIKLCVDFNIHYVVYGPAKSLFWAYPGLLEAAMTPSASSVTNIYNYAASSSSSSKQNQHPRRHLIT